MCPPSVVVKMRPADPTAQPKRSPTKLVAVSERCAVAYRAVVPRGAAVPRLQDGRARAHYPAAGVICERAA